MQYFKGNYNIHIYLELHCLENDIKSDRFLRNRESLILKKKNYDIVILAPCYIARYEYVK